MRHAFSIVSTIVLMWLLVACEGGFYAVTPTQEAWTPEPVPTSNLWRVDCMTSAQQAVVVNTNPCLSGTVAESHHGANQTRPLQYSLAFQPNQSGAYDPIDIWFNGGFVFDATMFSGAAGFSFSAEVDTSCHLLLVHADSTINVADGNGNGVGDEEAAAAGNFFVAVTLYDDGGGIHRMQDAPIAQTWYDAFERPHYRLTRENIEFLFPFYFEDATTLRVDVMFRAIWGTGNHGSTFRIRDIMLLRVEPGHCAGVAGF